MAGIDDLIAGDFFDAVLNPFISASFPAEMFYLFILAGGLVLIYMKTRSIGLVALVLTIVSGALIDQVVPTT